MFEHSPANMDWPRGEHLTDRSSLLGEPTLLERLVLRSEVSCVSVRGAWLAAGAGRTLRVWGGAAGGWREHAVAPRAHRYALTAALWGPAGALLASGGVDGCVVLWSRALASRRVLAAPGARAVRALCWAGGVSRLASGHDDGAVHVWRPGDGVLLARLHAHEGAVHALAPLAGGAILLTACTDGVLKIHSMEDVVRAGVDGGRPAPLGWQDGAHDLGALCADCSPCGTLVATGGHDARVRLWRAGGDRTLRAAGTLEGHGGAVTCVRWAGAVLASASLDSTARLWSRGACVRVLHAHSRYLTCVALDADLRFMVTGSNDKSVRVWSLDSFTLDEDPAPPCAALAHFALGDLQGIGCVEGEAPEPAGEGAARGEGGGCVWSAGGVSVNCLAAHGDMLAAACSEGAVRVWRWQGELLLVHTLLAHSYPALAVDFGADGRVLLSAGLDAHATLWDVETGVVLRTVSRGGAAAEGGGAGGAARGARVSRGRPALLLLATDDGTAPVWSLADPDPEPMHVYGCGCGGEGAGGGGGGGDAAAALCCGWSRDARMLCVGWASGELRLYTSPPAPRLLHREPATHDMGVLSCDFASTAAALDLNDEDGFYMLATAGNDSFIKLWVIQFNKMEVGEEEVTVRLARRLRAHGGGAASVVRVSPCGALLASGGGDSWARVWSVRSGRCVRALPGGAGGAGGAGGVPALALLGSELVALAALDGGLSVWRHAATEPDSQAHGDGVDEVDEGPTPRGWGPAGVMRWLREYVTRAPELRVEREVEATMMQRVITARLTGDKLLDDTLEELIFKLCAIDIEERSVEGATDEDEAAADTTLAGRVRAELSWLRRPYQTPTLAGDGGGVPHSLLCPITHTLLRDPVRAADGFTYEREHIYEWLIAEGGGVSPVSGRRLHSARLAPNYRLRAALRHYHHPPTTSTPCTSQQP